MNTASVAGLIARVAVGWMLAAATHLAATTYIWTGLGSDNNWSTGQNWSTSPTAPAAGDDLVFSGSTRLAPNNDLGAGTSFKSISIAVGAGVFVIG